MWKTGVDQDQGREFEVFGVRVQDSVQDENEEGYAVWGQVIWIYLKIMLINVFVILEIFPKRIIALFIRRSLM